MTRDELKERLKELDLQIASKQQWGAAITALNEERQGIIRQLEAENAQ